MANRLINESSPYLQQHAHNPVDWYPWGKEAFDRAARENKPVLLSIGYSTCHWCHVMERESFENEDTARLMNKEFVSIKVDREERPDLDHLYMEAAQAMTGRGGWPLTVFLTPEGVPFFAGTYFPPQDTMGMPGFPKVLITVAGSYHNQHARISEASESIVSYLNQAAGKQESPESLEADLLKQAYLQLSESFDREHGGFGKEPKFPQPMVMEFLLRYFIRSQEPQALEMVEKTLLEIARGGIHDQIGGGFHRYSTDARWLVPHFEKMLYDNALLSRIFLHAFQVTGKAIYSQVARKTLEYVLREMTGAEGGFFSAQDADSEGEEGKYYVWTDRQIDRVLGSKEGEIIRKYYGVTQDGNYEGNNILYIHADPKDLAGEYNLKLPELETLITDARSRLLSEREKRVHPGRDDKVLVVWNCLTVAAFAEAGQVLGENRYIKAAETCASLLLDKLWKDRNLLRVYNKGLGRVPAFLEDYASLGEGLLTLYEVTLQPRWFEEALGVASVMVEKFWDTSGGCFYDTANDAESLFYRPRNTFDNASPSGLSQAS
ncbi:MAG: thioredoxin domain-containing protein, partial [Dehalococcoidia bacterium]|nr:thioredoxin domain-containing protein [Dehalococcoidia bacterium]